MVALGSLLTLLEQLPPEVRRQAGVAVARKQMQPLELAPEMQKAVAASFARMLTLVGPCGVGCLRAGDEVCALVESGEPGAGP